VYGALESVAVLWRLRSYRDIIKLFYCYIAFDVITLLFVMLSCLWT